MQLVDFLEEFICYIICINPFSQKKKNTSSESLWINGFNSKFGVSTRSLVSDAKLQMRIKPRWLKYTEIPCHTSNLIFDKLTTLSMRNHMFNSVIKHFKYESREVERAIITTVALKATKLNRWIQLSTTRDRLFMTIYYVQYSIRKQGYSCYGQYNSVNSSIKCKCKMHTNWKNSKPNVSKAN